MGGSIVCGYMHCVPMHITLGCPSERAMVLAHIQKKGFMDVVRNTGIRGLYHGFEPTVYRDVSFNMVFFTVREIIVRLYRSRYRQDPTPLERTVMGIIGGTAASFVACPFDVVKTKIQGKELKSVSGEPFSFLLFSLATPLLTLPPPHPISLPHPIFVSLSLSLMPLF